MRQISTAGSLSDMVFCTAQFSLARRLPRNISICALLEGVSA
jgi:hypothetical protein